MLAIVVLGLAVLYRYGPSRADARWRWISWGSMAAAILWLIVSMLFSWYASNFGHYNKTYGSLGAVIAFMVWTWLSGAIVLMGGELNAEIEHQTARDSTTGPPKPLGARGAKMADTIGAAQD
jgi:membrane protein